MNLNTADILVEVESILGERHAAYKLGTDRIRNAISYCHRIGRDFPDAKLVADDILFTLQAASEISDMHPDRCEWVANRIMEGITGKLT